MARKYNTNTKENNIIFNDTAKNVRKEASEYMSFTNYKIQENTPQYVEKANRNGWIDWGVNNLYPQYLISLVNRSPLHNAIINMKASMIAGNGFVDANYSDETLKFIHNTANPEDLEEIYAKIAYDFSIFNGYCLNIRWSKDGERIAEVNYVSPESVRIAVPDEDTKYPDTQNYYVCDDWKNWRKTTPVWYAGFDVRNKKNKSQILYVMGHRSSNNWYPVPEYLAGVSLMELNYQINEFHLNTVRNEFSPSFHIHFPFIPGSIEQRDQMVNRLTNDYKGAKKAGNVVVTFGEAGKDKPTIEPITMNDTDDRFDKLTESMMDGIVSAHQLTDKKLLGLDNTGDGAFAKNERIEAINVFQAFYVAPKQHKMEKWLNRLAKHNLIYEKIRLETYDINLNPDIPMQDMIALLQSNLADSVIVAILVDKGYNRNDASNFVAQLKQIEVPKTNN